MARQMKDSGIEWIDSIPSHWKAIKLCYVTETIFLGKTPVYFEGENENYTLGQKNNQQYGLDFAGIKYSTDEHFASCNEHEFLQYGDVLLNSLGTGSVGRIGYFDITDKRVLTDGHIIVIRANEQMDARFLFFYLRTLRKKFEDDAVGSTNQAFLTVPKIYKTPIPFPPLPEQQRIAAFLDRKCAEIDTVIERTKATIEEYKKLKQAVITEAVTKGVRGPRPMKDSGIEWIGEIPEGWSIRKLKSFTCMISKGATPKDISREQEETYPIRFLKSENIVDNQLTMTPEFFISNDVHVGELKRSELSCDDILFVIAGASIGKVSLMDATLLPANTNQAVSFIRISKDYIAAKRFIWYVLQSRMMKTYITLFAVQSAQPNMSMEDLGDFRMPFAPTTEELAEIVALLDKQCAALDTLIAKKTALLTELETYKKSLIYEYVTGKKEVTA